MGHPRKAEVAAPTAAEDLAARTAKAVAFGCKHMAEDLAEFLDSLPQPEEPTRKAVMLEDGTDTFLRALSYSAAYTYGLCLLLRKDVDEAGRYFRRDEVQLELRASAMRVARSVMSK
jgi:hypothetical protein